MLKNTDSNAACSHGLSEGDFRQIAKNGFGEPENAYPHSMAWFKGHLFVGTTRHALTMTEKSLGILKRDPGLAVWPVRSPDDAYDLDFRAQIWRYDVQTDAWSKVLTSPMERGREGTLVPRSIGFRAMCAFPEQPEDHTCLYVVSTGGHHLPEAALFRSHDGMSFDIAAMPRLEDGPGVRSFRHFAAFKGKLFTAPTAGSARAQGNIAGAMTVMVTSDPSRDAWRLACEPGFGDPTNRSAYSMAACGDHLYVGTLNIIEGFQIWKTDAAGSPPYKWKKVLAHGAYRGPLNQIAMTLRAFGDHLYVGSAIQNGGYDLENRIGPAGTEVIRVNPDDSWDLLVGEPRLTPDGLKVPISGLGPGFNNPLAGYTWEMCEHEGWLYLGTAVRTAFLWFADWKRFRKGATTPDLEFLERWIWEHGGCGLWRTRDGVVWIPVTLNGFGNPYNYGVRRMVSTPVGLFVGLANPFGPDVAVRRLAGWRYEPNELSGLEILLGTHDEAGRVDRAAGAAGPATPITVNRTRRRQEADRADQVADLVDEFYGHSGFHQVGLWRPNVKDPKAACENLMAELVAFLPDRPGSVLDVACGCGATTRYLLRRFPDASVTGIATRRKDLATAKNQALGVPFVHGRLPALPFEAEHFDHAICVEGPGRIRRPERLFREILRVLRPGGRFIFSDVLPPAPSKARSRWHRGSVSIADATAYREFLVRIGFRDVRIHDVTSASCPRFHQYCATYFDVTRLTGEMSEDLVEQGKARLAQLAAPGSRYVLGSATKASEGRSSE